MSSTPTHYLTGPQIKATLKKGDKEELGALCLLIASKVAKRYSWTCDGQRDEGISRVAVHLYKVIPNIDNRRSGGKIFNFLSTCAINCYLQYLREERKHAKIWKGLCFEIGSHGEDYSVN